MTEIDLENKIIEVIDILKNEIDTKKRCRSIQGSFKSIYEHVGRMP